jgi:hypothetical protein
LNISIERKSNAGGIGREKIYELFGRRGATWFPKPHQIFPNRPQLKKFTILLKIRNPPYKLMVTVVKSLRPLIWASHLLITPYHPTFLQVLPLINSF